MTKFNFSKNAMYSALIDNAMEIEVTARNGYDTIVVDKETFVEFFKNEIERNTRKNSSKSSKPTAKQIENEKIKSDILEYMKSVGRLPVTISDIVRNFDNEYSIPKISALVKQLKDSGQVSREEIKRVAYFKVVE